MNELVLMAPIQVKENVSAGNVYDWALVDFYAKVRRYQGVSVSVPMIWNVNGEPIVKMAEKNGIERNGHSLYAYASDLISRMENEVKKLGFQFDWTVRDDSISNSFSNFLEKAYSCQIRECERDVSFCLSCSNSYGTDPSLKVCKRCSGSLSLTKTRGIFLKIEKSQLLDRLEMVEWSPPRLKKRLSEFIQSFPEEYFLSLSKMRDYTLNWRGYPLDPRFVAIGLLGLLKSSGNFDKVTLIHGDVMKKLDYYSLCYLNRELFSKVIMHGICANKDKKKIRWQNGDQPPFFLSREFKCYLLKQNPMNDVLVDDGKIRGELKYLVRLFLKANRILKSPVYCNTAGIATKENRSQFYSLVEELKYPQAFELFVKLVRKLEGKIIEKKLAKDEKEWLLDLLNLYYGGERNGIQNEIQWASSGALAK
jgi:hypothetical protein